MSILLMFLRSLLLTSVLSFAAPFFLFGVLLTSLGLSHYIPGLATLSQVGVEQINSFLATFGNGQPLEGLLAIGLACSLVGALFDSYTFYRNQILHSS